MAGGGEMEKLLLIVALIGACTKSAPDVTVENGVRVHYVTQSATCILSGDGADMCSMNPGAIRGGVKQDAWACYSGTSKTGGSAREDVCLVSITACNQALGWMRDAMAAKEPSAADITSLGECEIYRVRK